ncbi:MAG: LLM class flavin-dependent oxidoreductase [Chloroflexi bacterium]|jgi:F420-dependent oxidoreductase-like protein|nr:LLM class flavin-dependent oxidoreductase [Chloroflexota bacterium]MDP6421372.1 LLM class flavin-dependent oxidoreductase [SAR202 cluster bacterium]HAL47645.1 LLM class flavin-dependent oxidoreductase [Dehalococcoidia bacterium]MDP6665604.1 LLM class flavin-dependent oxidoreductase [SAR202 cluster bacterium]MDP6799244.1 LLM class flavin-dependent oxidoreductase [SAR202 cluster bacterium]|tara:strand:- start:136 stop:1083 length:948 start_codon:yes stop_codon:yes gene_type:complete
MNGTKIGVSISATGASESVAKIQRIDEMGIHAAWLTSGGGAGDSMAVLAAAAASTDAILLGTSIVQTWSRHPVSLVQQAQVIADLAPGRFRLGVGPSHRTPMERMFGADFRAPLGHLREYLQIVKPLIQSGSVEFEGRWYSAAATLPGPLDVPVMGSALMPGAFELCGAEADGAISWVCPHFYLRDTAMGALRRGARSAGKPTPPMIVHAPISVTDDINAARNGVRERLGYFPSTPFYARMFAESGFIGTPVSGWTDEMLDSVLISGDEDAVAEQIQGIFDWGASEVLLSVVSGSDDAAGSEDRTLSLLSKLSTS